MTIAICCFLQIFDISGRLIDLRKQFVKKETYVSPFQDPVWEELSERKDLKHLVWVSNNFENKEILEMSKWAFDNQLTMNNFYFARGIGVEKDTQRGTAQSR